MYNYIEEIEREIRIDYYSMKKAKREYTASEYRSNHCGSDYKTVCSLEKIYETYRYTVEENF